PPPGGPAACEPKVVRWPGGSVVVNGPEVVVRQAGPRGRSANVITGSGNGSGNTVVVDGGPGGVTVVKNARNGVGNRLVLDPDDLLVDLDAELAGWLGAVGRCKPAPADPFAPAKIVPADPGPKLYRGKANPFWDRKAFSEAHDCNLYWSPADRLWFRYGSDDDTYRPVADGPAAPGPLVK
ncbi:MAG: hypothetical protein K2X82_11180, partial [Gemmataceae bacterium]|nr:hypothetical protein [Gemmataceae bacterium]